MEEIRKASPGDAGCWIDGPWGQYAAAQMIEIAALFGYIDHTSEPPFATSDCIAAARRELAAMGPHMADDLRTDEERMADAETVSWAADDVEEWMNTNIAPDGHHFEWVDGEFFLTADAPDFWGLLESPPDGCEAVADLWSWSTNYDCGQGPATLFLDLIGYSQEEFGEALYNLNRASLGYLELGKLAAALNEYSDRPATVSEFVATLLEAETDR